MKNESHITLAGKLLKELERARKRLRSRQVASALLLFCGILFTAALVLLLPEAYLFLPAWARACYWFTVLVVAGFSTTMFIANVKQESLTKFYRRFCDTSGQQNIGNALDLYRDDSPRKSMFYNLAIERNLEGYRENVWDVTLNSYIKGQQAYRRFQWSLIFFSTTLLILILAGYVLSEPLNRSVTFWKSYERPNPFQYAVTPGDATLEHGTLFTPEVEFLPGPEAGRLTLAIKSDIEEEFRYRPMTPGEDGLYTAQPVEMTSNGSYFIEMDGFQTRVYDVEVQFRPRFESLAVTVDPPDYTGLPSTRFTYPFAQISAYAGSEIILHAVPDKPVGSVLMHREGAIEQLPRAAGENPAFETVFTAESTDTLFFTMEDEEGLSNRNPFQFVIQVREDQYPLVTIREPRSDIQLRNPGTLEIFYLADDDFGLTGAQIEWKLERAFVNQPLEGSTTLPEPVAGENTGYLWDLSDFDLRPRDRLSYQISVSDNDGWSGYKTSRSRTLAISVPSITASLEEIGEQENSTQNRLDDISDTYEEMRQAYEQFRRQMSRSMEPGWDEEQILDDVQERQNELEESARQLNEQFEEVQRELESNSSVSDETRRAYSELQEVMDDLDDPELRQALEELRESMESLNLMDLQNAMENFEFNEQVYRERLEQTLELFKTLKMNSDLDKLALQYDDMASRMDSLATGNTPSEQKAEVQQSVRDDMESVENQLETLDSRPPERSRERLKVLKEETLRELLNLQEEMDDMKNESSGTANRQENSEPTMDDENSSIGDGDSESDSDRPGETGMRQRQESIADRMQQRANSLREARQEMNSRQNQLNLLALQRSLYTLIEISESQEELSFETGRTENGSQNYIDLAREQNNINNIFSLVADTLSQIAAEVPAISDNINRRKIEVERILIRSQQQLAERNQAGAVTTSRESLGGINELASMIASLIEQLEAQQQNGGMGSGMMSLQQMIEQMQGMSQNQQQLNRELEQLINDIQGERLSRSESERLDQIARQQNAIRRDLENLQRSGAVGRGDRILSEMQRTMEEMENAINDMRGEIVDPTLVERQQNILSRMLNAEDALQERGEEEDEYEGSEPDRLQRAVPPDITMEELRQEIRTHLNDPGFTRFSDDYQRLIEHYFELLRQFEDGQGQ